MVEEGDVEDEGLVVIPEESYRFFGWMGFEAFTYSPDLFVSQASSRKATKDKSRGGVVG